MKYRRLQIWKLQKKYKSVFFLLSFVSTCIFYEYAEQIFYHMRSGFYYYLAFCVMSNHFIFNKFQRT